MGKSTPSAPQTPNYITAATDQGAANLKSGLQSAGLSNPNIISPYGNQKVTFDTTTNPDMPQATVEQTLTPEAKATLDAQQKVQLSLANLGLKGTETASNVLSTPFQYSGPAIQTSLKQQKGVDYGPAADKYGLAQGIDAGTYGMAQRSLDLSNIAKMPVNAGTTGQAAILSRLQPQIQQEKAALEQQLANQGITPGSEAYNNAMRTQGQQANDLYTQAALQGINLDTAANQQGYGQALSTAGLYNTGLGQDFSSGLAARGLTNQSIGQNFGQGITAAGFYNQAQNQAFNQAMQEAQFGNTSAQQDLAQQLQLRNQPLNEISALMSGSQIQNPQFQGYTGANVAAAPVFQGAQAQGQAAQDIYGQQMAANNAKTAALGQIAGAAGQAAMMKYSDVRLKSDIVKVGDHPLGIGIYEYDIFGRRERGVMAHEVFAVKPEAVIQRSNGYLMVNYGAL